MNEFWTESVNIEKKESEMKRQKQKKREKKKREKKKDRQVWLTLVSRLLYGV
jgi:hypothetical protein